MGIGGSGMSPIAHVLHDLGYKVDGCDMAETGFLPALRAKGIDIQIGHSPAHLARHAYDALIVSSAVPETNPELLAAKDRGITVMKRAGLLGALMENRTGIAIAGTHGKTTTTAMIAHLLTEVGRDPTYIIGGTLLNSSTNARAGSSDLFVVEADEYDGMFLGLVPRVAVITTLEMDHPDMFEDLPAVRRLFTQFVDRLPTDGMLIAGHDDTEARAFAAKRLEAGQPATTYGVTGIEWWLTGWQASNIRPEQGGGIHFTVERLTYQIEDEEVTVEQWEGGLLIPGEHNVENALAAIAAAAEVGVDPGEALAALGTFRGTGRRFEVKGTVKDITVIDDYAHHPTAIEVTLDAARDRYPEARIWAVWQPHTYSRTAALLDRFARSFYNADHVIITDVYRSRDTHDYGVSEEDIVDEMLTQQDEVAHIGGGLAPVIDHLVARVEPGDVVIIMSAGDATQICEPLLARLGDSP